MRLLKEVLLNNIGKSIMILIILTCSTLMLMNSNRIDKKENVISSFYDQGEEHYITVDNDGNYEVEKLSDGYTFNESNNTLEFRGRPGIFWGCLLIGSLALLVFLGAHFDSDTGWDYKKIKKGVLMKEVSKDKEGDKFYYHLRGKLLIERDADPNSNYDSPVQHWEIEQFVETFIETPNVFDDYIGTLADIRESRLSKILNK